SIYAHYPGLIVMTPATVEDAYTMLIDAVAIDDPVVYCEHKYLYYHLKADKLPDKGLPTGRARIAREGRDLTIVTYSAMVQESLAVAGELARENLEIEVVDLRTVKPLDTDTVLASVARTGRLLCVGESFPWGGATAEVIARVTNQGFHLLDAAPQRLNAKDTPIPYHPHLWSAHQPHEKKIPARARALGKKIAASDGEGVRVGDLPVPAITKGATFMSPRVRARMAELQLTTADLAGIMGTGASNRVTIKDLENFLHKIENQTAHEA